MSALVILALFTLILILVLRLEWSMMTDTARAEVLCGEDLAAITAYPAILTHEKEEDRVRRALECSQLKSTVDSDRYQEEWLKPVEWVPPLLSAFPFPLDEY